MAYENELQFAKDIALEAGEIIRNNFRKVIEHELKADESPVTVADKAINSLLIERVKAKFPDHAVIGEEESFRPGSATCKWVCDPIDGTIPFMHHLPISSFSLALVVDGESVVGVIYDAFQDRLWSANRGQGAFCNDQKINVSDSSDIRNEYIMVDWRQSFHVDLTQFFLALKFKHHALAYNLGTTAYLTGLVADGSALAVIGSHRSCWDIAAAAIIVEEAGGKVTDIAGNRQRYDQAINGAVISNGKVHDKLISLINENSGH